MLKIITWIIVTLLMSILFITNIAAGTEWYICLMGGVAIVCDIGMIILSILEYKHIKKLEEKANERKNS